MLMINTYVSRGWIKNNCGCGRNPWCSKCDGSGVEWISPRGRIADYPGGPFRGQLSKLENAILRRPKQDARDPDIRRITLEYGRDSRGVSGVLDARIEYK